MHLVDAAAGRHRVVVVAFVFFVEDGDIMQRLRCKWKRNPEPTRLTWKPLLKKRQNPEPMRLTWKPLVPKKDGIRNSRGWRENRSFQKITESGTHAADVKTTRSKKNGIRNPQRLTWKPLVTKKERNPEPTAPTQNKSNPEFTATNINSAHLQNQTESGTLSNSFEIRSFANKWNPESPTFQCNLARTGERNKRVKCLITSCVCDVV
jgi:hypothetical protein